MLQKFFGIILSTLVCSYALAQSTETQEKHVFKIGVWDGRVQLDSENRLISCSLYGYTTIGQALHFVQTNDGRWILGAESNTWSLIQGQTVNDVILNIDRNQVYRGIAGAASSISIALTLPFQGQAYQQLVRGNTLNITLDKKTTRYSLKDLGQALGALDHCVAQFRQTDNTPSVDPNSETVSQTPQSSDYAKEKTNISTEEKIEATLFVSNLFGSTEFRGYTLMSHAQMSDPDTIEWITKASVAWSAPNNILGGLHIFEGKLEDLDSIVSKTISEDAVECTGSFLTTKTPEEAENIRRVGAGCKDGDGLNGKIEYIFFARPDGLIYRFGIFQMVGEQGDPRTKADEIESQKLGDALKNIKTNKID